MDAEKEREVVKSENGKVLKRRKRFFGKFSKNLIHKRKL